MKVYTLIFYFIFTIFIKEICSQLGISNQKVKIQYFITRF